MTHKISFISALIISINIMLGSGIFINTVLLTKSAGALGSLAYLIVGILIFPLIFAIAQLLKYHQGGTFYDFGKTLHPFIGFISIWSYFTSKIASAGLSVHIFTTLIQTLFPLLALCQPLVIDTAIIIFFGFLNILNIRIGSSIQKGFIVLKLIPILFVIVVALFLFMPTNYTSSAFIWSGIPGTIPFVLFAFSGFEAVCSLSQSIDRPEKNGPRAIYLAFGIVLTLTVLYQTSFFGILGMQLAHLTSFRQTYPVLLNMLFVPASALYQFFSAITLLGIAASSLGASYGILYSNSWNLYTLAQSHHIPFFRFFGTLNRHRIPLMCVFIEVIAALGYLWLSQGNQVPLQQISACGSTIAYSLSAVVFCYLSFWVTQRYRLLSFLSLLSCSILLWALFQNGRQFGAQAYMLFSLILLAGTILFIIQRKTKLA